jgi:hypothetical protein
VNPVTPKAEPKVHGEEEGSPRHTREKQLFVVLPEDQEGHPTFGHLIEEPASQPAPSYEDKNLVYYDVNKMMYDRSHDLATHNYDK